MDIQQIYEWSKERYIVAINGRDYIFRTREEAEAFLAKRMQKEVA